MFVQPEKDDMENSLAGGGKAQPTGLYRPSTSTPPTSKLKTTDADKQKAKAKPF
jgi:hypothetical protein